jgi:hypothetical protein
MTIRWGVRRTVGDGIRSGLIQSVSHPVQVVGEEVGVGVERHDRRGVPEHSLNRFDTGPG